MGNNSSINRRARRIQANTGLPLSEAKLRARSEQYLVSEACNDIRDSLRDLVANFNADNLSTLDEQVRVLKSESRTIIAERIKHLSLAQAEECVTMLIERGIISESLAYGGMVARRR